MKFCESVPQPGLETDSDVEAKSQKSFQSVFVDPRRRNGLTTDGRLFPPSPTVAQNKLGCLSLINFCLKF